MLERYKEWVRRHPGIVQNLDWLLLLTVWNPSRTSGGSEATYEAYHAAVGLLSLWHQHIIEEKELPTSRPTPYLLLDALEYVETLIELRGMRLEAAGKMSRYSPLLAVELAKAGLKMAAWSRYSAHMFLRRPSPDDLHQFESELGLQDILASLERLRSRYTDHKQAQLRREQKETQEGVDGWPASGSGECASCSAAACGSAAGAGPAAPGCGSSCGSCGPATADRYGLREFLGEQVGGWAASLYGAVAAVADACQQQQQQQQQSACGAGCSRSAGAAAAQRQGVVEEQAAAVAAAVADERARSGAACSTSLRCSGSGGGAVSAAADAAERLRAVERWEWPATLTKQAAAVYSEIEPEHGLKSSPAGGAGGCAGAAAGKSQPPQQQAGQARSACGSTSSAGAPGPSRVSGSSGFPFGFGLGRAGGAAGGAGVAAAEAAAAAGDTEAAADPEGHMGRNLLWLSELLHIWRPVVYVSMLRRYGRRSWRPWFASLALDLLLGHFRRRGQQHMEAAAARAAARAAAAEAAGFGAEAESGSAEAEAGGRGAGAPGGAGGKVPPGVAAAAGRQRPPALSQAAAAAAVPRGAGSSLLSLALARSLAAPGVSPGEERELYERRRKLLLYALRSPFLEATTLSWLSSLRSATSRVPLLGAGADYLYGLVDTFTAYYCYTSGSN
ncbi:hypothetical protein CHLRE_11g467758v5 [Chlamydomonas reinhardtii]|uniref:Peroxisomal membrane protein PEX16 n=1 Tax=Chlamydomonas reinhardtii TaxID=3055 RepID=A0A2K3D7Y2_CHLRE|nr:uncharacterized protein CHLRE_11g467758v5 [Chlamydomonas reinhardtii]PNW76637.1 hypothetical protein CHLRE_11g467758v5 [Chlamydomonas reinhardtii]